MSLRRTLVAGRYRLLEPLGFGGAAVVFLAEDLYLKRRVAIKRLRARSPAELARRFGDEARLGASLSHVNIVSVFDTVADEHGLLIVMEYVAGETLAAALRRGRLPSERAIWILLGLAGGLDYAHGHGVVHRDVKPANVLLGDGGTVKLADLGVATATDGRAFQSRTVVGTPAYMAPEQLRGGLGGPAVDIYALGAVAYEMLAGRRARVAKTTRELAHKVSTAEPPDLRMTEPAIPRGAARLVQRAMARDPRKRPPSATEFVDELASCLRSRYTRRSADSRKPARRTSAPSARRGPSVAVSLVATLLLAAACVLGFGTGVIAAKVGRTPTSKTTGPASGVSRPRSFASPKPPGPAVSASDPQQTVRRFYARLYAGDFAAAWTLTAPQFQREIGFSEFTRRQGTLAGVELTRAVTLRQSNASATVGVQTLSVQSGRTYRCNGALQLARSQNGDWLLDPGSMSCTPAS